MKKSLIFLIVPILLLITSCQPKITIEQAYSIFKDNKYTVEFYDYSDILFINNNLKDIATNENYNGNPNLLNKMTFEIIKSDLHHWGEIYQFSKNVDARFIANYLKRTEYNEVIFEDVRVQDNLIIISSNFVIVNSLLNLNL
jgi:hypothetical protein